MRTQKNTKTLLRRSQGRGKRRGRSILSRKRVHARGCGVMRTTVVNPLRRCVKVADKLEALKNLIPSPAGEISKPDQLFKETADYIILLRTQVLILQKLIEFYGSSEKQNSAS
ncbi:hypothetical protein SLE2022_277440 [Rubroshorea leprosula]|uniref:Uncharacterized protein n=1 Tax=Rubroshorea leprosula TaxID=152421 RepID=A0AAV5ICS4_9ROSI|nr:hypothetical protein SLEP1_g10493 [Rubroshorea leprosula]